MLGLVKEGAGPAFQVLSELGLDLPRMREEVQKLGSEDPQTMIGALPRRADVHAVIEHALEKSRELNHPQAGTGHLLVALLSLPNTKGTFLLGEVVLNLEELRAKTLAILETREWTVQEYSCCLRRRPHSDSILLPGSRISPGLNNDIAAIRELQARWVVAERASDWDALVALCTEDAVWAPPRQCILYGRAAIHTWSLALPRVAVELTETLGSIALFEATAYVRGEYVLKTLENDGGTNSLTIAGHSSACCASKKTAPGWSPSTLGARIGSSRMPADYENKGSECGST